jgi:NAD+-processing family protein with receiver domain
MGWAERANPKSLVNREPVNLWLDDFRPAPEGWEHVTNVEAAKHVLLTGMVKHASLDHDLGACVDCLGGLSEEEWLERHGFVSMPHCSHVGTGYDLVCWMEETGHWPEVRPTVHSANPVGAQRMRLAIAREWTRRANVESAKSVGHASVSGAVGTSEPPQDSQ